MSDNQLTVREERTGEQTFIDVLNDGVDVTNVSFDRTSGELTVTITDPTTVDSGIVAQQTFNVQVDSEVEQ